MVKKAQKVEETLGLIAQVQAEYPGNRRGSERLLPESTIVTATGGRVNKGLPKHEK
ncbi:hypothetical protein [Brevibacillus brevis]|uniref:hypothetical protein n=1 Tax=Brevibacillus brevis TaxID=1393 RepID=UPI0025A68D1C|nr:hypothetical protein [Brevibacillus brevis]WJQ82895.1 hypothetical protein QN310_07105 [Brevibacillus brevis]